MKLSACTLPCSKLLLNVLVAVSLSACGSGGGDSSGETPAPPQHSFIVSSDEGGYVFDADQTLYCESDHAFCEKDTSAGSIESLSAVARFGYVFSQWHRNGVAETSAAELQLIAGSSEQIASSFQKLDTVSTPICTATGNYPTLRALHLGDSLTAGQCWGNCPSLLTDFTEEPTRESVRFYTSQIASNTLPPRAIAMGGQRINGTNLYFSPASDASSGFGTDNYWNFFMNGYNESTSDFDIAIVALGSNDLFDFLNGQVTMDFIFENRVKPLLAWIGDMPVVWVLPNYSLKDLTTTNFNLYSREDGLACACGDNPPTTTQCNVVESLQQCGASEQDIQYAVAAFKAAHEFRQRMAALQYDYPNLHVADAAELIARQSQGRYDLFQQLLSDHLHLSKQGMDWLSWAQAYLAQTSNPACPWTISTWQAGAAESDMAAQLALVP